MTEIQELICTLQDKVKKEVDELTKMRQQISCLESLIENNMGQLRKIVDSMSDQKQ